MRIISFSLKSMELYGKQIYAAIVREVKQASTAQEGIHAICMLVNTAVELRIIVEQADRMANESFMRTVKQRLIIKRRPPNAVFLTLHAGLLRGFRKRTS
ncbi:hypothetical protein [Brevibacillus reuszeri]|uniref:hypothetical protein n=1 Tax=Brevibacillus reuszeri TaxID=54915 RepID=UPI0013DF95F7|nr:hypothetical protein [Brevibacillus reuszeri]